MRNSGESVAKKTLQDRHRWIRRIEVMMLLGSGHFAFEIVKLLNVKRGVVRHDIDWLLKEKYIVPKVKDQNKYKFYLLTDLGAKTLGGVVNEEQNRKIKAENYRWKSKITNNLLIQNFLDRHKFKKVKGFKNTHYWNGYIEGWTIQVFLGKRKQTMVFCPPVIVGKDLLEIYTRAETSIVRVANSFNKKWKLGLETPEPMQHHQFAINDDFAKTMLKLTNGSQVKIGTTSGTISIDQSGGEPRVEFPDYKSADDYLKLPVKFDEFKEMTNKRFQRLEDVTKNGFDRVATVIERQSEMIEKILTKSEPEKIEPKALNSDAKKMFG